MGRRGTYLRNCFGHAAVASAVQNICRRSGNGGSLAASWAAGAPREIDYKTSFVDGIGGKGVFQKMFERARDLIDGTLVTELAKVAGALRLIAERNRVIAEECGCLSCGLCPRWARGNRKSRVYSFGRQHRLREALYDTRWGARLERRKALGPAFGLWAWAFGLGR